MLSEIDSLHALQVCGCVRVVGVCVSAEMDLLCTLVNLKIAKCHFLCTHLKIILHFISAPLHPF